VLSLSAKGLTGGEIAAHVDDVYGASVSQDTISGITDKVLADMAEWARRPLDPVYPKLTDSFRPTSRARGPHRESTQTAPTGIRYLPRYRPSRLPSHVPLRDRSPDRHRGDRVGEVRRPWPFRAVAVHRPSCSRACGG
jgi:Transposase, Mutator family